ncbi:uncharacterized protein LOC101687510 [Mustela putorius furo]|uniref:Uncharacterized protein LOC101687510 n=1 Tax=Mustela putorius furo TaxID=9669 RepID=A0A8U0S1S7_MUSPF|nr:uncharacterized protein LOC101687510 [Mustela putorius furo]
MGRVPFGDDENVLGLDSVTWSRKYLSFPLPYRGESSYSLLPETRCPLFPGHLQLPFSTLLSSCSFSIFSVLASSASGPVNANVLRDSNQAARTPRGCSRPNPPRRTRAHTLGSLRASASENPAARECKVSEGQRGLPAHRQSLPRRRKKTARLEPRLRRRPARAARAPRATEGSRDVPDPLLQHRPRQWAFCAPPPPGPEEDVPASARAWTEAAPQPRQRRGQREKERHSPASAPSPHSTGSSHPPVARIPATMLCRSSSSLMGKPYVEVVTNDSR